MNDHQLSPAANRAGGFTLVEVLVVLAIISMTAALISSWISRQRGPSDVELSARSILHTLKMARLHAIKSNRETSVLINASTNVINTDFDKSPILLPPSLRVSLVAASTDRMQEHEATIRFFSDGSSSGAMISIGGEKTRAAIAVDWLTGVSIRTEPADDQR